MTAPAGVHPFSQAAVDAALAADAPILAAAQAAQTTATNAGTAAAAAQTTATAAQTAATTAQTTSAALATNADSRWFSFLGVTTANSPVQPTLMANQTATVSDPAGNSGATYLIAALLAETVAPATAANVTVTLSKKVGSTVTDLMSKVVPLSNLGATNNVVNLIGVTSTNPNLVRVPAGASLQISISVTALTGGTQNFYVQVVRVPTAS